MLFLKLEQGWGYRPFRRRFDSIGADGLYSKKAPISAYRPKMKHSIKMKRAGKKL